MTTTSTTTEARRLSRESKDIPNGMFAIVELATGHVGSALFTPGSRPEVPEGYATMWGQFRMTSKQCQEWLDNAGTLASDEW